VRSIGWRVLALVLLSAFTVELRWAVDRGAREARAEAVSFEPGAKGPLSPDFPRTASPFPAFRLVDQDGRPCDESGLHGRPTVMSFVFAHCQTVCPVLARSLTRAARELGPGRASLALVTLDPWRDTPASLPGLAQRWSLPEGTRLLSGPPDDVCRLLDTLDVARERDLRTGDVSHVPLVMVLDAEGRIVYRFLNPPVEWIVEAVRRVERGDEVAVDD
jgi:cytochrome oxidase Cu insertion factor (SCO1/SenC/PrrC family)